MQRLAKLAITVGSTLLCLSTAYSGSVPNTSNPTTFLGPTARLGFTSTIADTTAYSLLGEAGLKNFRVGGTLGFKLTDNQLFKISAEYLWQDITYAFFSGNSDQWMNQGAVGAAYQYDLAYPYHPQLGVSAYYSHAPSKTLNPVTGTFVNGQGNIISFVNTRRIAGSNALGVSPGITISPWWGSKIGAELNYDDVRYDTHLDPTNENAQGFGGTIKIGQAITDAISINVAAAVRQPFNNYSADLDWNHVQFHGDWTFGLFGDYNAGKNTLPDTWNLGLSADYLLDQRCPAMVPANLKGDLKGEVVPQPVADNLLAWTADPAVYMPRVLAIVDDPKCGTGVALLSPLPNFDGSTGDSATFNSPSHFSGGNLVYSLSGFIVSSLSLTPVPFNQVFSIDPVTGVVTMNGSATSGEDDTTYSVTVTASNGCSSVSSTFTVFLSAG